MKKSALLTAIDSEALLGKSKLYITRALKLKDINDLDQYQLWVSLALELLGKAILASIHPSLVVDPTHYPSLFAASGYNLTTDVKTISTHTPFEGLRHLSPEFDEKVKAFCEAMALRRNAELHSGEVPFRAMLLAAWEKHYWHACQQILTIPGLSLEEWLGTNLAKAPAELILHTRRARIDAALVRVERAKEAFLSRKKKDREDGLAAAELKHSFHYPDLFKVLGDEKWEARYPACSGKAFLTGNQYGEEVVDDSSDPYGL